MYQANDDGVEKMEINKNGDDLSRWLHGGIEDLCRKLKGDSNVDF